MTPETPCSLKRFRFSIVTVHIRESLPILNGMQKGRMLHTKRIKDMRLDVVLKFFARQNLYKSPSASWDKPYFQPSPGSNSRGVLANILTVSTVGQLLLGIL